MAASRSGRASAEAPAARSRRGRGRASQSSAATSLREEVRNLKKEKIVEAAARLFFEHGYHGSSIESICSELGVTKPFVYYHFLKKDDILKEIYMSALRAALETFPLADQGVTGATCATRLEEFVRAYVALATSEMRMRIALITREQNLLPDDMMKDVRHMKRKIYDALVSLIAAGADTGEFRVNDPGLTAQSIFGLMNWTVTWFRPGGRISRDRLADEHVEACLRLVGWQDVPASPGRGRKTPR